MQVTKFLKKERFFKRKRNFEYLSLYLSAGYSLSDSIEVLGEFKDLKEFMLNGGNIDQWFGKEGFGQIASLVKYLDLKESLIVYQEIEKFKKEYLVMLKKLLTLPVIQLILAICLSIVAQFWIMPSLSNLMGAIADSSSVGIVILSFINIVIILILVSGGCVCLLLFIKERSYLILLLNYKSFDWLKKIYVYRFVMYYLSIYKRVSQSEVVIICLKKMEREQVINQYASLIDARLNSGVNFIDSFSFLDEKLSQILKVGEDTVNVSAMLEVYLRTIKVSIDKKLKQIGLLVQIFSYGYIGFLVVVIYQMLLLPLNMIEGL